MRVGIAGIKGKISKAIAYEVAKSDLLDLSSALVRHGYDEVGMDIGEFLKTKKTGTFITDNIDKLFDESDIVVDFSSPKLTLQLAEVASKKHKILITGTRGLDDDAIEKLKEYSNNCAILCSNNMSITYNLLLNLVNKMAMYLNDDFVMNITNFNNVLLNREYNKNSNLVAKSIAEGKGWDFCEVLNNTQSKNIKSEKTINFSDTNGLNKVEHTEVIFNSLCEELKIEYEVNNDFAFVKGALKAIFWMSGKKSGFYTMKDIFEF